MAAGGSCRGWAGGLDIGSIIGQIASAVSAAILMVIVGLIKQAMGGKRPPEQRGDAAFAVRPACLAASGYRL